MENRINWYCLARRRSGRWLSTRPFLAFIQVGPPSAGTTHYVVQFHETVSPRLFSFLFRWIPLYCCWPTAVHFPMIPTIFLWLALIQVVRAAEVCEAGAMKREQRCANIFEDLSDCRNASFKPMLMDCLVTCGSCDSYRCQNPQPENVLNCTALADQCEDPTFVQFMKEKCPFTCGKCDVKNSNLCKDLQSATVCSSMAPFCNSVDYYDLLTVQCPSTCNRCSRNGVTVKPGECADMASDCAKNSMRCTSPNYAPLMHRLCRKTCNACNVTCEDQAPNCASWVNRGFCRAFKKPEAMKSCAKSCNFCSQRP
ncbi:unnamed protein product [Caenorhabditis auriculariae]|uniref:ShKT domain-containing protein n=1 Tax=Caenorhabditis auriculariae TaxID=2777116 RepID=A0A8S1GZI6_9PELO|nr:unnamed protein product [Caenorhabditis auriculariae]